LKVFHCDHCDALVFFENVQCVSCGHALAFLPDLGAIAALTPDESGGYARVGATAPEARRYRLCRNYTEHNVCNWAIENGDEQELCRSCRLTTVIPDLSNPKSRINWTKLETAKRRLVYTLMTLDLPLSTKQQDPEHGLAFEFKVPSGGPDAKPVLTGHANGVITINATEADDAQRERVRNQLHEPYRTLLGHFRHEIGHYYWDRLIAGTEHLAQFRTLFGDEQQDYAEALKRHYDNGPPPDWQERFVSTYSTAHPWEDWAETFAHYLHMYETLDTAAACGLMLKPRRSDEPTITAPPTKPERAEFDQMMANWFPLTYALNNLNRGLGQADAYPFVLSAEAIGKLRFVHEAIRDATRRDARVPSKAAAA
jgi:hypothetical protein